MMVSQGSKRYVSCGNRPAPRLVFADQGVVVIADVVFGKGWGLYILWFSIGLIAYVYSLSRSTTAYCQYIERNEIRQWLIETSSTDAQFATSSFGEHTVIGTIGVINGIIAGVAPPFIAKVCCYALQDRKAFPLLTATSSVYVPAGRHLVQAACFDFGSCLLRSRLRHVCWSAKRSDSRCWSSRVHLGKHWNHFP